MGVIYKTGKMVIRVNGSEHPPIHVHVTHTDGRAMIYLGGTVKNSGIPDAVIAEAKRWIAKNEQAVIDEWKRWN